MKKSASPVEPLIDHMKATAKAETDIELAAYLEIDPSTIAAWRMRKRVPSKYVGNLGLIQANPTRDASQANEFRRTKESRIFALVGQVAVKLSEAKDGTTVNSKLLGFKLRRLYYFLDQQFLGCQDESEVERKFQKFSQFIAGNDVETWVESLVSTHYYY